MRVLLTPRGGCRAAALLTPWLMLVGPAVSAQPSGAQADYVCGAGDLPVLDGQTWRCPDGTIARAAARMRENASENPQGAGGGQRGNNAAIVGGGAAAASSDAAAPAERATPPESAGDTGKVAPE